MSRRALLISSGALFVAGPARAFGSAIHVSNSSGNDAARGDENAPVKTLRRAAELAQDGAIALRRGDAWHEMLTLEAPVELTAYGDGPDPVIDGDGKRHGILIRRGHSTISDIHVVNAKNGVYVVGADASAAISGVKCSGCGTGIAAGEGGNLKRVEDVICELSKRELGAGDGIQISEDAGEGPHVVMRAVCNRNEMSGINFKKGAATVGFSQFSQNGECGVLAQVNADTLDLHHCLVSENNRSDNGTFNLALENKVSVRSRQNRYLKPQAGELVCNNANITGSASLTCEADEFLDAGSKVGASVRLAGDGTSSLTLRNCSFYADRTNGIVIDAYGAPQGARLMIVNCAFWSRGVRILRYPEALLAGINIDFNCYYRADGGAIVEIQDRRLFKSAQSRELRARTGGDRSSVFADPGFLGVKDSEFDFDLSPASPARGKGNPAGAGLDNTGRQFADPPNIGSRSN